MIEQKTNPKTLHKTVMWMSAVYQDHDQPRTNQDPGPYACRPTSEQDAHRAKFCIVPSVRLNAISELFLCPNAEVSAAAEKNRKRDDIDNKAAVNESNLTQMERLAHLRREKITARHHQGAQQ